MRNAKELIRKIQQILREWNIAIRETETTTEISGIFTVHLHIDSGGLLSHNFITNGKGFSKEEALAGAYCELMERLQTGIILDFRQLFAKPFLKFCHYTLPNYIEGTNHYLAPDEVLVFGVERDKALMKFIVLHSMEYAISNYPYDFEICLPFYNPCDNDVELIPILILEHSCGSNGMAAGESVEDAILRGMLEIFERYALRQIYDKHLTPPKLDNLFYGTRVYDMISSYCAAKKLDLQILDCSAGLELPVVIGILFSNKSDCTYAFHISSGKTPTLALENAFLEMFQTGTPQFRPLDFDVMCGLTSDICLIERERVKNSFQTNHMPASLFRKNPSYNTIITDMHQEISLSHALNIVLSLGYKVFVRDVSFTGIPTVWVYIPGMSELVNVESMKWFDTTFRNNTEITRIANKLSSTSVSEIERLVSMVSKLGTPEYLKFLNSGDVWHNGNPCFVLGVLSLVISDINKAKKYLKRATFNEKHPILKRLYSSFYDYAVAKSYDFDNCYDLLITRYSQAEIDLIEKCVEHEEWRKLFNFTDCFDCMNCKFTDTCSFPVYLEILQRREQVYKKNIPSQKVLSHIFYQ